MSLRICLLALMASYATAADIQRRGFSFRPARVDPEDTPSPPTYHSTGDDVPYAGSTTHLGDDILEPSTPQYPPAERPNECLQEACAELTKEVAEQLIEQMINNLGDSTSSTTTIGLGTQVQAPTVTAYSTRSLLPNHNVAESMTLDQDSLALFNEEEQDMYFYDRLCFYANVERRYVSAATAAPTPTRLARRQDALDLIQSAETASPTPLASADAVFYQQPLWNTRLPNAILSIYAPVTANGSMTTATTTCSALGGASSFTMPYVQARVSSSPTPSPVSNEVEGAGNVQAKAGSSAMFGAVVALFALVVI